MTSANTALYSVIISTLEIPSDLHGFKQILVNNTHTHYVHVFSILYTNYI